MGNKIGLKSVLAAVGLLALTGASNAATCVGNCNEATAADGVVTLSPDGGGYRWISSDQGVNDGGIIESVGSDGGEEGSKYTTSTFSAAAGDTLQFYFNYVTSDGSGYADYGWAELQSGAGTHVAWLFTGRTQPSGNTSPGFGLPTNDSVLSPSASAIIGGAPSWSALGGSSGTCFNDGCGYTGWIKSTYNLATAGIYQLVFGVTNWSDSAYDSGLAFDGAQIAGISIDPGPGDPGPGDPVGNADVPIPGALVLLGSALAGLGAFGRRKKSA